MPKRSKTVSKFSKSFSSTLKDVRKWPQNDMKWSKIAIRISKMIVCVCFQWWFTLYRLKKWCYRPANIGRRHGRRHYNPRGLYQGVNRKIH